jgi:RimJ/RimL family protein N-acetyltransferase
VAYALDPMERYAPSALAESVTLADGTALTVRPIELSDAFGLRRMFDRLSPETIYHRFFSPIPAPRMVVLQHLAAVDHDRREALVALVDGEIVAVARFDGRPEEDHAEIAVTVEDAWQGRGVGTELLYRLARIGRRRGLASFTAVVMGENSAAVRFLRRLSPDTEVHFADGEYAIHAPLRRTATPTAASTASPASASPVGP